jgi:hypothetical protein
MKYAHRREVDIPEVSFGSVTELRQWVEMIIASIPEAYHDKLQSHISNHPEDPIIGLMISYMEPWTKKEIKDHEDRERKLEEIRKAQAERYEREMFDQLKNKFDPSQKSKPKTFSELHVFRRLKAKYEPDTTS